MIHKFKALGLALAAIFAMSAMVAAAAQATPGTLTAGGQVLTPTGEQVGEHVLTFTDHPVSGGTFANYKCKKTHFDGKATVTDGATTFTLTPTLSECTAFGQPMTINHTECNYLFHTGTKLRPERDGTSTQQSSVPLGKRSTLLLRYVKSGFRLKNSTIHPR